MVTPGKMKEVISKRLLDLSAVKVLVLDEADDMVRRGMRAAERGDRALRGSLAPDRHATTD